MSANKEIDVAEALGLDDEFSDWRSAFEYASGQGYGGGTPEVAAPGLKTDTKPFDECDVAELYGLAEGENEGPEWVCYGKLKDGRYFSLAAGCDYTGWD